MRRRGTKLCFSLLLAITGMLFFAAPASAAGASIGSCIVEKLEHIAEEGHHADGHDDHGVEHLFHSLHAKDGATEEEKKKVDHLEEAEKDFYRIINEVKLFHLQNAARIFAFHLGRCCCHFLILLF